MRDLLLDPVTGDLMLVDGELVLTRTPEELIRQQLQVTLRTYRGEWKYDINQGVPWTSNENNPTQILGKTPKHIFDLKIRESILSVRAVRSIKSYQSEVNTATQIATIAFTVDTSAGLITETVELKI